MSLGAAACGCLSLLAVVPPQGEAPAAKASEARDAAHWVRELERPGHELAAVRELVALGPAALPALHKALATAPAETMPLVLFACSGLPGDVESLREPIRRHLRSKHLGTALAARDAWLALDGRGRTIVADIRAQRVVSIDTAGEVTVFADKQRVRFACPLPEGRLLLGGLDPRGVFEIDAGGREAWSCATFANVLDAERLPNGNTLVADLGNGRVVEVDHDGRNIWSFGRDVRAFDVDRLANGNTLIAIPGSGIVEIDAAGQVVWQWANGNARDGDRLPDGTTLVTCAGEQRVVRIAPNHDRVAEWRLEHQVHEADLLPNGNLLVAGIGGVIEYDPDGREVWRAAMPYALRVVRIGARPRAPAGR